VRQRLAGGRIRVGAHVRLGGEIADRGVRPT
jgi:hypothetical protein